MKRLPDEEDLEQLRPIQDCPIQDFHPRRAPLAVRTCLTLGPLLVALCAAGAYAQRLAGARISFAATRCDLGTVNAGASTPLLIPFRNTGTRPLEILGVEGDCGCVTPIYPKIVPAGKSAEIAGRFEAQPAWGGRMERSLRVRTNDASQPEVGLSILVDVVPFVRMDPPSPLQMYFRPGQVYRKSVKLTPREGSRIRLSTPTTASPVVRVKLDPPASGDPKRAYTLHVTFGPRSQPGDFSAVVKLQTTEPRYPEVWLAVMGLAESGPVVNPSQVTLPVVPAAPAGTEVVRLQVFTRLGTLKLLSVDTGTPALRAERLRKAPGPFHVVSLRTTARWKSGNIRSTIRVRTDDPKSPVVTVPFQATAQ